MLFPNFKTSVTRPRCEVHFSHKDRDPVLGRYTGTITRTHTHTLAHHLVESWQISVSAQHTHTLTLVLLVDGDLLGGSLDLEQQLDAFDRCYGRFRDSGRDTTGQEILGEAIGISLLGHFRWIWSGDASNCKKNPAEHAVEGLNRSEGTNQENEKILRTTTACDLQYRNGRAGRTVPNVAEQLLPE